MVRITVPFPTALSRRMPGGVSMAMVLASAITAALVAAWGFADLQSGRALAGPVVAGTDGTSPILRGADGHYWTRARIDGQAITLMVDTGAAAVVLSRDDARRLGLDADTLTRDRTVRTASGTVAATGVRLSRVVVAGVEIRDVEALVVDADLPHSLLGMSFLGRLSGFSASPEGLVLVP